MAKVVETTVIRGDDGVAKAVEFKVNGQGKLTVELADLQPGILWEAVAHGIKQKIGDAAALERDEKGKSATAADKWAAMKEVFERVTDAEEPVWNARGEGDGMATTGLLVAAIAQVCEMELEDAKGSVASWDRAKQAQMRADPTVAAAIAAIKAERAAKRATKAAPSVDTSAILAELRAKTGPGPGAKKAA